MNSLKRGRAMVRDMAGDRHEYREEVDAFAQTLARLDRALEARAKMRASIDSLVDDLKSIELDVTELVRASRRRANDARQTLLYSLWQDTAWGDSDDDDP